MLRQHPVTPSDGGCVPVFVKPENVVAAGTRLPPSASDAKPTVIDFVNDNIDDVAGHARLLWYPNCVREPQQTVAIEGDEEGTRTRI